MSTSTELRSDSPTGRTRWGISQYPAILGHEVVGRVTAVGPNAKRVRVGQRVGVEIGRAHV